MDIKIQIIIAVGVLIAMCVVVNMIRRKNLELRHALTWLAVGASILVLDCFPNLDKGQLYEYAQDRSDSKYIVLLKKLLYTFQLFF